MMKKKDNNFNIELQNKYRTNQKENTNCIINTEKNLIIENKNNIILNSHTINYDDKNEKIVDEYIFTDNSFFIFSLNNPFRIFCQKLFLNEFFDFFILLVIICNSIVFIKELSQFYFTVFYIIFLIIFFFEFLIKSIALGFIIGKNTYLKDLWNCLDFFVLISSFLYFIFGINFTPLRLFKLIKIFRTINLFPHLTRFIDIFIDSFYDYYKNYILHIKYQQINH